MSINFKKFKKTFVNLRQDFPLIFARRVATIFIIGAIVSLSIGSWFFYKNAYSLTVQEYEVFLGSRRINSQLLDDTLLHIEEQGMGNQISIPRDPFRP